MTPLKRLYGVLCFLKNKQFPWVFPSLIFVQFLENRIYFLFKKKIKKENKGN